MNRRHAFALLLVFLISGLGLAQQAPAVAQPQPASPAAPGVSQPVQPADTESPAAVARTQQDRAQIRSLVQQFDQAAINDDVATIDRMLAPNYHAVNAWGVRENKNDILHAHNQNDIKFEAVNVRDENIQVNGDTATEQNTADVKGVYKGTRFDGTYSSTRTFQRQPDGSWQIVSFVVQQVK